MRPVHRRVPTAVLERSVDGYNLPAEATLGSTLAAAASGERAVLLVFLRHYG